MARRVDTERAVVDARRSGGASRDRTDDLRVANATLSQLSYGPLGCKVLLGRDAGDASCSVRRKTPMHWWVWEELNLRPHPYQGCALTN